MSRSILCAPVLRTPHLVRGTTFRRAVDGLIRHLAERDDHFWLASLQAGRGADTMRPWLAREVQQMPLHVLVLQGVGRWEGLNIAHLHSKLDLGPEG